LDLDLIYFLFIITVLTVGFDIHWWSQSAEFRNHLCLCT